MINTAVSTLQVIMSVNSVNIIGGGIIGLAAGWQLARRGISVRIFERGSMGRGASFAAAGMLTADAELGFEEKKLYRVSRESLGRWPAFAHLLEEDSGVSVGYQDQGTLVVANDRDHEEALRRMFDFQLGEGVDVSWLSGEEARDLEPFLAPGITGAVLASDDHAVDNRAVLEALVTAFQRAGGELFENSLVTDVGPDEHRPRIVMDDGSDFDADVVVIAAGAWSNQIKGLENGKKPPVRPVKGQIIELQKVNPFDLKYVVRGPNAYLVPHLDGRIMVGATSEEMGYDTRVTAGGIYKILEGGWEIVPGIYDLSLTEIFVGLRPGSRDNHPIMGFSDVPGVYFATGHFRHGILHSALSAEEIALEICESVESEWLSDFRPQRFA